MLNLCDILLKLQKAITISTTKTSRTTTTAPTMTTTRATAMSRMTTATTANSSNRRRRRRRCRSSSSSSRRRRLGNRRRSHLSEGFASFCIVRRMYVGWFMVPRTKHCVWSERGREREREDFRHSLRFVNLFCLVLRVFSAASKLQEATT